MTVLQTRRLTLRPWTDSEDDLAFLYDMYSREQVQRYIGTTPRVMRSVEEARERVDRWRAMEDAGRGVWAATMRDGTRLGTVLCKPIPWSAEVGATLSEHDLQQNNTEHDTQQNNTEHDTERNNTVHDTVHDTEIGWHFHPDAWGHGYASEAATVVLRHAFGAGIQKVVAVTNPANAASQRVCLRIGMTAQGSTTRYYDTTCELFEVVAPGRRCVAFFRNVNQGQRGHPSTRHLIDAMTDAGFSDVVGFRGNGTMLGTAVGAPSLLAADTADALTARSGEVRDVFVMPLDDLTDIVDAFAPTLDTAPAPERLELSLFDPRVTIRELPARGIRCEVIASGPGWAVTRNELDDRSQATPSIERLIGSAVTSRGMGTVRGLVGRHA